MTDTRTAIVQAITAVAPEVDGGSIEDDMDFIEELDLDSMDQLNIAVEVCERTGVDIPEIDQNKIRSVSAYVRYVDAAKS